jgi:hypothetical protein
MRTPFSQERLLAQRLPPAGLVDALAVSLFERLGWKVERAGRRERD